MVSRTLGERKQEVELMMKYAVPEEHFKEASELLERHAGDSVALNLLHHFYSFLPDARDDGVKILRLLARRQGVFLMCVTTFHTDYLYLTSTESAMFLGMLSEGITEQKMLAFFGFGNKEEFMEMTKDPTGFSIYSPSNQDPGLCPVCSAANGEYHTLGCPVEVCPWCRGQLTQCNCRFIQLDQDCLNEEIHIERLQEKIEEAGRIPFETQQRPAYPSLDDTGRLDEDY